MHDDAWHLDVVLLLHGDVQHCSGLDDVQLQDADVQRE